MNFGHKKRASIHPRAKGRINALCNPTYLIVAPPVIILSLFLPPNRLGTRQNQCFLAFPLTVPIMTPSSLCTVDFEIPNFFAASLTVHFFRLCISQAQQFFLLYVVSHFSPPENLFVYVYE